MAYIEPYMRTSKLAPVEIYGILSVLKTSKALKLLLSDFTEGQAHGPIKLRDESMRTISLDEASNHEDLAS